MDEEISKAEIDKGIEYFLGAFRAKRFANHIQEQAVVALVARHGYDVFREGVDWAAKLGMDRGRAILSLETALPKWGSARRKTMAADLGDRQRFVEGEFSQFIVSGHNDWREEE